MKETQMDEEGIRMGRLNARDAHRAADREAIVRELVAIASKHGATVERRDDGPNPGFHGRSVVLRLKLGGVGATIDVDDLHGGGTTLIHWYGANATGRSRNLNPRFHAMVLSTPSARPHHKATSCPDDWHSLAMALDAGLALIARGDAFMAEAA